MPTTLSPEVLTVLQSLSDAALVVDSTGRIVFVNDRTACLLGYDPAALVGRDIEDLLPAHLREQHVRHRQSLGTTREPRRMGSGPTFVAQRADGTDVPVDISLDPIGDPTSSLTLACVRDMSEYARLLAAAEKAEDRYRMVVDSASEVFYRVRLDGESLRGKVEFVSPQCQRITGISPEEFLANPGLWLESVHPDDRPVLFQTTESILRNGVEGSRYYRLRHRETGEYRWVADRVVPLRDGQGAMSGYQGVARDVTERRRSDEERQRLEEELRLAQKMEAIGRLAGSVAHDFNNLVTVILASCDSARTELGASPIDEHLTEIIAAGQRASELTRQLLTLSHEQPSAPRVLDLNAQLTSSKRLIRRMLPEGIALAWELGEDVWPVRLDESQLDQVVFNLAANARDAMPNGGVFSLATRNVTFDHELFVAAGGLLPGDYVQLAFTDTGVGMDAATIAHVFEPFYTTKPPGEGTGLGLASVYGIIKQNRGDIHIESAPGVGTRVTIHFPRCRTTTTSQIGHPAG